MGYKYIIGTELLDEEQVKIYLSFLFGTKAMSSEEKLNQINKEATSHFSKFGTVLCESSLVKGLTIVK